MDGPDGQHGGRFSWFRDLPAWLQVVIGLISLVAIVAGGGGVAHVVDSNSTPKSSTPPPTTSTQTTPKAHPVFLDTLTQASGGEVTPGQVSISRRTYQHGLQFEVSLPEDVVEASYTIPTGARTFSAAVGNDDNQPNSLWMGIPLLFEVFVDGRRVATGHARGETHDPALSASVVGGSTVTLKVTNVGDAGGATRADWGDPLLH
jgi:NPCBM/NEW2 domain